VTKAQHPKFNNTKIQLQPMSSSHHFKLLKHTNH